MIKHAPQPSKYDCSTKLLGKLFLTSILLLTQLTSCSWITSNRPTEMPSNPISTKPVPTPITISGSATYFQRIAMPPDAVLSVAIEDISIADVPAVIIAQQTIPFNARQVPIPFSLIIDPALITPNHFYSLRASILVRYQLAFTTTEHIAVLGNEPNTPINAVMQAVAPALVSNEAPPAISTPSVKNTPLHNTQWNLIALNGVKLKEATQDSEVINITLDTDKKTVSGFSGCNRLMGVIELNTDKLIFKHPASTMMACDQDSMNDERNFIQQLVKVNRYQINGDQLILFKGKQVIARFTAQ